jgi:hypothetical protein
MSMCIVAQYPSRTPEFFESLVKQIAPEGLPKGIVTQVVGSSPEGVTVVTVWDSDEAEQYFTTHVKPVLDKSGANPKITKLQIHKHFQRK